MESSTAGSQRGDDERTRYTKRMKLKEFNAITVAQGWLYSKCIEDDIWCDK